MAGSVRRVVTGTGPDGRAQVVSDERVDAMTVGFMPGAEFVRVWGADTVPTLPDSGDVAPAGAYFPPPGGFRCYFVTLPPAGTPPPAGLDPAAVAAELDEKLPGLAAALDPDHPGMHATDTVDWNIVLEGAAWLALDSGERLRVATGDSVIVTGGSHSWESATDEPCRLATVSLGCSRQG